MAARVGFTLSASWRWIKSLINARMLVCVCACHAFMRMHG